MIITVILHNISHLLLHNNGQVTRCFVIMFYNAVMRIL